MIYSNDQDHKNEIEVLNIARANVAQFFHTTYTQNKSQTAIFDFSGWVRVSQVDVKVRNIASFDYTEYFISLNKVNHMRAESNLDHYIVYYFTSDRVIRVYHLEDLEPLQIKSVNFTHARANEQMKSEVYLIPARRFMAEFYIQ